MFYDYAQKIFCMVQLILTQPWRECTGWSDNGLILVYIFSRDMEFILIF